MKKDITPNETMASSELKRAVTENFLNLIAEAIQEGVFKNELQFCKAISEDQSKLSRLKSAPNRYVCLDVLYKAVHNGIDPAALFFGSGNPRTGNEEAAGAKNIELIMKLQKVIAEKDRLLAEYSKIFEAQRNLLKFPPTSNN